MKSVTAHVGIDVSKSQNLVSINQGKPFALPNSEAGFQDIICRLTPGSVVHLEASGGYERLLRRALQAAGFEVRTHNALKARRLAQGLGVKAKTDPVDAKGLSAMAPLLPAAKLKSQEREQLADFSRLIVATQEVVADFRKRLGVPGRDPATIRETKKTIECLEQRVRDLEKEFAARIKASSLAADYDLLLTIPGVGPKTTRISLCELPENFKEQEPSHIASYAGLAPINDESGKRTGKASVGRGNARLKAALYMPSMGLIQKPGWAKELYARLRAKRKTHPSAMVAVMRRLLLRIVAVLKRGSPWRDEPSAI